MDKRFSDALDELLQTIDTPTPSPRETFIPDVCLTPNSSNQDMGYGKMECSEKIIPQNADIKHQAIHHISYDVLVEKVLSECMPVIKNMVANVMKSYEKYINPGINHTGIAETQLVTGNDCAGARLNDQLVQQNSGPLENGETHSPLPTHHVAVEQEVVAGSIGSTNVILNGAQNTTSSDTSQPDELIGKRANTLTVFRCKFCDKVYTSKGGRTQHMNIVHGERTQQNKRYSCSYCERKYTRKIDLQGHINAHMGHVYKCSIGACGKTYTRERSWRDHEKSHLKKRMNQSTTMATEID